MPPPCPTLRQPAMRVDREAETVAGALAVGQHAFLLEPLAPVVDRSVAHAQALEPAHQIVERRVDAAVGGELDREERAGGRARGRGADRRALVRRLVAECQPGTTSRASGTRSVLVMPNGAKNSRRRKSRSVTPVRRSSTIASSE